MLHARTRRRRSGVPGFAVAAVAAVAIALAAGAAGCADDTTRSERIDVGRGAHAASVFVPRDAEPPYPLVIFLHGWGAPEPAAYRAWIEHLVDGGNAVVYPAYQDSPVTPPVRVLGNALIGIRAALGEVEVDRERVVVAGHSAGGALAADYAAIATSADLPRPRAVLAAYPGRRLRGLPVAIPAVDPAAIAPDTWVVALAGSDDEVVGDSAAEALVRGARRVPAARRRLIRVTAPDADDHLAPQRADAAARREFWARLDRLVERVRGGAGGG